MRVTPIRRSRGRRVVAVVLGLAVLAGCGSDDDEAASTADTTGGAAAEPSTGAGSTDALIPAGEGTTTYPLTLTTWAGETVLEERPERVAVIGFSPNLDSLQALDATPVYSITDDFAYEWRDEDFLEGIELLDPATRRDPVNFEAIATTRPDLIVAVNSVVDEAMFDTLAAIAPVLDVEELTASDRVDWRAAQRLVGEALDLPAASEEVITEAEATIGAAADTRPELAGRTITIAYDYPASPMQYFTAAGGTAESIMEEIGFTPNPAAADFVEDAEVSEERLPLLESDVLVVLYDDEAKRGEREGQALFQSVPAVADGRYAPVVFTDPDSGPGASWVMRRGASAVSVPWAAEVVVESWLADVDLG